MACTNFKATTVDEWSNILSLADQWGFQSIRARAIKQLMPIASDIEKIVLGKHYGIWEWLVGAYTTVCGRFTPLSEEEFARLGVREAAEISLDSRPMHWLPSRSRKRPSANTSVYSPQPGHRLRASMPLKQPSQRLPSPRRPPVPPMPPPLRLLTRQRPRANCAAFAGREPRLTGS